MAVVALAGFETRDFINLEGGGAGTYGSPTFSTAHVRTGSYALRTNPSAGTQSAVYMAAPAGCWGHVAIYVVTAPASETTIWGSNGSLHVTMRSDRKLSVYDATTLIGTSTTAVGTDQWVWLGLRYDSSGTSVPFLQIAGTTEVSGTSTRSMLPTLGSYDNAADAYDIYWDDYIVVDSGFIGPSKVALLLPTSDQSNSSNLWTGGDGTTTTNLYQSIDNVPPSGVASANEVLTTNIRCADRNGGNNFVVNLMTPATRGVTSSDTLLGLVYLFEHGEDISTGTKTITVTGSYPTLGGQQVNAGGDNGAHGVSPTGWAGLSVVGGTGLALNTSPQMSFYKGDSTTRVACIDFAGAYLAYTPPNSISVNAPVISIMAATRQAVGATGYAAVVLADNPLHYYRMDESSGTTLVPTIGSTGTYTADAGHGATSLLAAESNTAHSFSSNNYATLPSALPSGNEPWTMEAWVKVPQGTTTGSIVSWSDGTATFGNSAEMRVSANGRLAGYLGDPEHEFGTSQLDTNTPHHVALTYDGTTVYGYVDGTQVGAGWTPGTLTVWKSARFIASGSYFLTGVVDEVVIYATALSAARIAAHYNAGSPSGTTVNVPAAATVTAAANAARGDVKQTSAVATVTAAGLQASGSASKSVNAPLATVTAAANAAAGKVAQGAAVATATGAAQATASKVGAQPPVATVTSAGLVARADIKQGVAVATTTTATPASRTDIAQTAALATVTTAGLDATGVGVVGDVYAYPEVATVTAGTQAATAKVGASAAVAGASTAASAPAPSVGPVAAVAAGTATTPAPSQSVRQPASAAAATVAANLASTTQGIAVNAPNATSTASVAAAHTDIAQASPVASVASSTASARADIATNAAAASSLAAAYSGGVLRPVWTTPGDGTGIAEQPVLAFTMPATGAAMHFEMRLDTVATFDSGNLRDVTSATDQSGWTYWDGGAWQGVPADGVPAIYGGNEARYTVPTPLAGGTWYRQVRAGV